MRARLQRIAELRPQRSATAKDAARSRQKTPARVGAGSLSRRRPRPTDDTVNAEQRRSSVARTRGGHNADRMYQ